jgi:hypothetical protein
VNISNSFEDALRVGLAELAASQNLDSAMKPSLEELSDANPFATPTQPHHLWTHKWGVPVLLAALSLVVAATLAITLTHPSGTESSQPLSGASADISGAATASAPVYAPVPRIERACPNFASALGTTSDVGLVTVDPRPTALVAAWYGGMNRHTTPCVILTRTTAAQADLIAKDLRGAAASSTAAGIQNCAFDDGYQVVLYFSYTGSATLRLRQ